MTMQHVLNKVAAEYVAAREKHRPLAGAHEGYAVILEELDEAWADIKADRFSDAKEEMIQVAAMAVAFILET